MALFRCILLTSEIENLTLPMKSYPGCHVKAVHWLYWNSHAWSSSDVIVLNNVITSSCISGYSGTSGSLF